MLSDDEKKNIIGSVEFYEYGKFIDVHFPYSLDSKFYYITDIPKPAYKKVKAKQEWYLILIHNFVFNN